MLQKVTKLNVYLNWTHNIVNLVDSGRVVDTLYFCGTEKKKEIYETITHKFLCRNFYAESFMIGETYSPEMQFWIWHTGFWLRIGPLTWLDN